MQSRFRKSSRCGTRRQRTISSNRGHCTKVVYRVGVFFQVDLLYHCLLTISLTASEEMIRELTSQLSRVDSLTREGKTSTLHFLTREAADEERRGVERQVEQLKAKLKEKDLIIAEREATISDKDAERSSPGFLLVYADFAYYYNAF